MENGELVLNKENGIATLTLNRPENLNAMTTDMWQQLPRLVSEISDDDSLQVLVVTGAGRAFCAGSDVGRLASRIAGEKPEKTRSEITAPVGVEVLPLAKLRKPTIAAVNGVAAAAGISIALACDIRIASEEAKFVAAWAKMGLIPDGGATYYLTRLLGVSKTMEFVFTGKSIAAAEAEKIGLVSRVVPGSELLTAVNELAVAIAKGPPIATELAKKAIYRSLGGDIESQLDFESYAQNICRQTEDYKEGVQAFMQKRQPEFKGR